MAVKPKTETASDTSVANPTSEVKTMTTETTFDPSGLPANLRLAYSQLNSAIQGMFPMLPPDQQTAILQAEAAKIAEANKVEASPLPKPDNAIQLFFQTYLAAGMIPANNLKSPNGSIMRSKGQWNPANYSFRIAACGIVAKVFLEKGVTTPDPNDPTAVYNAPLTQSEQDALDDLELYLNTMFTAYPTSKHHEVTAALHNLLRKLGWINEEAYHGLVGKPKNGTDLPVVPTADMFAPVIGRLIMDSKVNELISLSEMKHKEWKEARLAPNKPESEATKSTK